MAASVSPAQGSKSISPTLIAGISLLMPEKDRSGRKAFAVALQHEAVLAQGQSAPSPIAKWIIDRRLPSTGVDCGAKGNMLDRPMVAPK